MNGIWVRCGVFAVGFAGLTLLAMATAMASHGPRVEVQYKKTDIKEMVRAEAMRQGTVPIALALGVARVESNFNANALSSAGARGVMQIMPRTARTEFGVDPDDLWDPALNIRLGIRFLSRLYAIYGNRWDAALSHYNGGTLDGDPLTAPPHGYTRGYVASVLKWADRYEAETGVALAGGERYSDPAPVTATSDAALAARFRARLDAQNGSAPQPVSETQAPEPHVIDVGSAVTAAGVAPVWAYRSTEPRMTLNAGPAAAQPAYRTAQVAPQNAQDWRAAQPVSAAAVYPNDPGSSFDRVVRRDMGELRARFRGAIRRDRN